MNEEKLLTWELIRNVLLFNHPEISLTIAVACRRLNKTECPSDVNDAVMVYEDEVNKLLGRKIRQ